MRTSLAGQAASVFLGLGALVAFASWFQMRLEENERLEKLEVEELARAKGESALFESKASEVFPARRAREQFEKFLVPGFAVLLFLLEAGGAWLLWRWTAKTTAGVAARTRDAVAVALRHFRAAAVFVRAVFGHHRAAGSPPAAASQREFFAGGRVCLFHHRAGHRRRQGAVSPRGFSRRARILRAAGADGGGNPRHAAAGNLPPAREGQGGPAALRQPARRACSRSPKACSRRRRRRWITSLASRFRRRGFSSCCKKTCRCCCWRNWPSCCFPRVPFSLNRANRRCSNISANPSPCSTRARISSCRGRWIKFIASARSKFKRSSSATFPTSKAKRQTRFCGASPCEAGG